MSATATPRKPRQPRPYRDIEGRFMPGNPGGPGNPFARRTAAYKQLMHDAVTDDDLRAITRKLVEQAKDGDTAAAKIVLQYTAGRPAAVKDPDRVDIDEWKNFADTTVAYETLDALLKSLPAGLASIIARITWCFGTEVFFQRLLDNLDPALAEPTPSANGVNGAATVAEPAAPGAGETTPSTKGANGAKPAPSATSDVHRPVCAPQAEKTAGLAAGPFATECLAMMRAVMPKDAIEAMAQRRRE